MPESASSLTPLPGAGNGSTTPQQAQSTNTMTHSVHVEQGMKAPLLDKDGGNWFTWKGIMMLQFSKKRWTEQLCVTYVIVPDPEEAAGFDWDAIQADASRLAKFNTADARYQTWKEKNDSFLLHIIEGLPMSLKGNVVRLGIA
jgi:hypothetical protein